MDEFYQDLAMLAMVYGHAASNLSSAYYENISLDICMTCSCFCGSHWRHLWSLPEVVIHE